MPRFDPGIVKTFDVVGLADRVERTRTELNDEVRTAAPILLDLALEADADPATYARPDGIHFGRAGYRALGVRIAETLEEAVSGRPAKSAGVIYPSRVT